MKLDKRSLTGRVLLAILEHDRNIAVVKEFSIADIQDAAVIDICIQFYENRTVSQSLRSCDELRKKLLRLNYIQFVSVRFC